MQRRITGFLLPFAPLILAVLVVMVLRAGLIAGAAWMVKPILDENLLTGGMLRWAPLFVLVFYGAKSLFEFLQSYGMAIVGDGVCRDLREALHARMIDLPVSYFHDRPAPTLLAHLIADISFVQHCVQMSLVSLLKDGVIAVALGALLFYRNWRLAALAVVMMPLAVYPLVRLGRFRRDCVDAEQESLAGIAAVAYDGIVGNKIVKAFGTAAHERGRFRNANDRYYELRGLVRRLGAASTPLGEMALAVGAAVIVGYAGYELTAGTMTVGALASFFVGLGLVYEPVKRMGRGNLEVQAALGALGRVGRVLDEPPEAARDDGPPLVVSAGAVEFRRVGFRYGEREILRDVSFSLPAGRTLALVGPSGAGKSTVMDLLAGFLEPTSGTILIDGQDIGAVPRASLRAHLGLVPQDVYLFNDTARVNIAYGTPDAGQDAVQRAAEMAEIHDVLVALPAGYETRLGERGARLSGGERQRIAIARALLKNAPILLLDEATSALDAATEARVQRSLERLMAGRTVIVIAHRLATVQTADHIVVLDDGAVVEQGTHATLLAGAGLYQRLHQEQRLRPD